MNFTDIFIRRPVLAIVVSLLILVLGLRSLVGMSVQQYPETQSAQVIVSTTESPRLLPDRLAAPIEAPT